MPEAAQSKTVLRAEKLSKTFTSGYSEISVLSELDLTIQAGEVLTVVGASGSGKSTLLHLLGGLDQPNSGSIFYGDIDITSVSEERMAMMRNRYIGFVFQYHHLMSEFTAVENIKIPMLIAGYQPGKIHERAMDLLQIVGLADRASHLPSQMSGGEQQRVALARALANNPPIILADEPTGNLDRKTGESIYKLLYSLARNEHKSWVVVTHNEYLAQLADKRRRLDEGRLFTD